MKKKNSFSSLIKTATIIFSAILIMAMTPSCKKDSTNTGSATVSEEEAAEAVTDAVIPTSGGMAEQTADASAMAKSSSYYPCGDSFDSSITKTNVPGATVSYSINLQWNWKLTCANPAKFQLNFTGHNVYDASRMSSDDNGTATFEITGIEPSAAAYVLNANYVRQGTQQSKIRNKYSFSSTITITSTNINIDKSTLKILSGTASAGISGSSSSGKSFSYSGTITFLGNQKATLTMQSGQIYQVQW